jgi:hypothetical protein
VGPYTLVERQEGEEFFEYYRFYEGRDSVGSNGYNMYVGMQAAQDLGMLNVSYESDELDVFATRQRSRSRRRMDESDGIEKAATGRAEPFVYMGSSPTVNGPRDSIRLEGIRRFNRGLFVIDLRHMPAGMQPRRLLAMDLRSLIVPCQSHGMFDYFRNRGRLWGVASVLAYRRSQLAGQRGDRYSGRGQLPVRC